MPIRLTPGQDLRHALEAAARSTAEVLPALLPIWFDIVLTLRYIEFLQLVVRTASPPIGAITRRSL